MAEEQRTPEITVSFRHGIGDAVMIRGSEAGAQRFTVVSRVFTHLETGWEIHYECRPIPDPLSETDISRILLAECEIERAG